MTTKQQNKLAMYLTVKDVLDANNSVWQPLQAFADGYIDFTSHVSNIRILGQTQMMDNKGIAQDKHQSKFAMATAAVEIAAAVRAYAVKTKNNTLAAEMDFSLSDLARGRDADAAKNCQNIHDIASAGGTGGTSNIKSNVIIQSGALDGYGVTADKLTALQSAIDTFNTAIGKPRDSIVSGKTVTGDINAEFDGADEALEEGLDNLIGQFQSTNAKFVSDYRNARTIVDTAASHASPKQPQPAPQASA